MLRASYILFLKLYMKTPIKPADSLLSFPVKICPQIGSARHVKIREPELKKLRIYFIRNRNRGKIKVRAYCCYVFLHRKPYDPNMPQGEQLSRSNVFLLLKGQGSSKKKKIRQNGRGIKILWIDTTHGPSHE